VDLFSPGHLIVLLAVMAVLFFGWKQLPDMARSAGRSMRVFRTELKGMTEDDAARDANRAASTGSPAAAAPATPVAPTVAPPVVPAATDDISATDGPAKAAG
jgi:sec-independent protein translocase protein TatA